VSGQYALNLPAPLRPHVFRLGFWRPSVCHAGEKAIHENPQVIKIGELLFQCPLVCFYVQFHGDLSDRFHFPLLSWLLEKTPPLGEKWGFGFAHSTLFVTGLANCFRFLRKDS
jgi:hypothetical protein